MNLKKHITIAAVIFISVLMIYGGILANQIFSENTKFSENELYVHVPTGSSYEDVKKIVAPYVEDMNRFDVVANKKSYPANVKSGRFLFKKGMNSNELINALRLNLAVNLAFNNQERLEDFAGRIDRIERSEANVVSATAEPKQTVSESVSVVKATQETNE